MKNFEFIDSLGTVDLERIKYVENEIGYKLPQSFIDCISQCDGCTPLNNEFCYYDMSFNDHYWTGIGRFLCLNQTTSSDHSLLNVFLNPPEFFPEGLVPFADTGGGDLICFDYRENKNNIDSPVVYWSHESNVDKSVSFVSKNFEEFLKILE